MYFSQERLQIKSIGTMASVNNSEKQQNQSAAFVSEPVLPNFGLMIACEKPTLQLCKPKLLPLKTYSYMKMQMHSANKIDRQTSKTSSDNQSN